MFDFAKLLGGRNTSAALLEAIEAAEAKFDELRAERADLQDQLDESILDKAPAERQALRERINALDIEIIDIKNGLARLGDRHATAEKAETEAAEKADIAAVERLRDEMIDLILEEYEPAAQAIANLMKKREHLRDEISRIKNKYGVRVTAPETLIRDQKGGGDKYNVLEYEYVRLPEPGIKRMYYGAPRF